VEDRRYKTPLEARIKSIPVLGHFLAGWTNLCLTNRQFLCGNCFKPVTIQSLPAGALLQDARRGCLLLKPPWQIRLLLGQEGPPVGDESPTGGHLGPRGRFVIYHWEFRKNQLLNKFNKLLKGALDHCKTKSEQACKSVLDCCGISKSKGRIGIEYSVSF